MERWQVIVELTYEILGEEGEHDALYRAKDRLQDVLATIPQKPFEHYHIVQHPRKVVEFD